MGRKRSSGPADDSEPPSAQLPQGATLQFKSKLSTVYHVHGAAGHTVLKVVPLDNDADVRLALGPPTPPSSPGSSPHSATSLGDCDSTDAIPLSLEHLASAGLEWSGREASFLAACASTLTDLADVVPRLLSVRLLSDTCSLAIELPAHRALADVVEHLPVPQRVEQWLLKCVDALAKVHAAGFIHGDLKPEHLRVDAAGNVVLIDWGFVSSVANPTDHCRGTRIYVAPEVDRGGPCSQAADVYSFGLCLLGLILETPPPGDHLPYMRYNPPTRTLTAEEHHEYRLMVLAPPNPRDLARAIHSAVWMDPARRPTMVELRRKACREMDKIHTEGWPKECV